MTGIWGKRITKKRYGCSDGCSFFTEDWDLRHLPYEKQAALERAKPIRVDEEDEPADLAFLYDLFVGTQRKTCIGGLIKPGTERASCKYFAILDPNTNQDNLTSVFLTKFGRLKEKPWRIATFTVSIATLLIAFGTYQLGLAQSREQEEAEPAPLATEVHDTQDKIDDQPSCNIAEYQAVERQRDDCLAGGDPENEN